MEDDTATLTITGHSGDWYHKYTAPSSPAGTCSTVVSAGTDTASLSDLTPATSYTFKAYSDTQCASELTTDATDAEFLTKPAKVADVLASPAGTGSLLVSWTAAAGAASYKIQWKTSAQQWDSTNRQTTSTTASKTLTGLTDGTQYTVRVLAANSGGDGAWSDTAAGTPSAVTLAASAITATSATLTIGNHTGNWYYKYTAPAGGLCSSAQAGTTAKVTTLRKGTTYTFRAYSDVNCAMLLTTAPELTTLSIDFAGAGEVADQSWTVGETVDLTLPATAASGACTGASVTYTLTPALPAGLSFSASTRKITGTPTTQTATAEYTFSATDAGCSQTATRTFDITVAASPDIQLSRYGASLTEGGADRTYTARLKSAPAADVTVTVTSGDAGAVTASPASLTFTTTSWSTARTVTLSAVQDADGSDESVTVTHAAAGLGSSTLTATVTDDDKGLTLGATSLAVPEGASRTYTVALAAAPSGDVTVATSWQGSSAGVTRSPASLTFTTSSWSAAQTVTVTASHDADDDNETRTLRHATSGGGYGTVTADLPVYVDDDENPGLVVAPSTLALTEAGAAGTFTVKLGGAPDAGRTVTVAVASGDAGAVTASPSSLTFTSTSSNWNTSQTVTVTPVQDADPSDESVTVTMTASGGGYDRETGAVTVTVEDDEAAGLAAVAVAATVATLTITNHTGDWYWKYTVPASPAGACSTAVSGTTASAAHLIPATTHTIKAYSDVGCTEEITNDRTDAQLLTKPGKVTGMKIVDGSIPGNPSLEVRWTAQSGTVTGYKVQWRSGGQDWNDGTRQKAVTSGARAAITGLTARTTYWIRVTAYNATGDGAASSQKKAAPSDLQVTNPGLTVTPGTLSLTEGGGAGTFTVIPTGTLGDNQSATTTVAVASSDPGAAAVSPTLITFVLSASATTTPSEVVTVTPVDDADSNDESVTVTATAAGAHDGRTGTVTVTIRDDEAAALAAGAITATTATLTIAAHTGDWYHKHTAPSEGQCSTVVSGTTASLANLDPGTSYTFKAYSDVGCATEITTNLSDADFLTKPGQAAGVTAASGNVPGAPSLAVRWTASGGPSDTTDYRVQWRSGYQNWNAATRQITVTGGATAASITGLVIGATYTVRVIASNATGDGPASAEASGVPAAAVPGQPTILTVREGDAGVTLSWTAGADGGAAVTGWEVSAKAGGGEYGAWTAVPNGGPDTRRHTVTSLTNGVVHRFKVRAVNSAGAGAASAESAAATPSALCGRTPAVRDAIVAAAPGKTTCGAVTATDLAGLTGKLDLADEGIASLRPGDFAGLTGLTQLDLADNALGDLPAGIFDPLTALTSLNLLGNELTTLPAGVFDRLAGLASLSLLDNGLTSVPDGLLDRLTALTWLDLGTNGLTSLPAGIFDRATALVTLYLDANKLTTLPAGVFDELTALKNLYTQGNELTCLPFIPASVTGGTRHATLADASFAACGAGVTPSASSLSVGAGATETYTLVLDASPNRFADGGDVTVTATSGDTTKATVSPATLTFGTGNWSTPQAVTVTGVATGSATITHTVAGGGYGAVTAPTVTAAVTTSSLAASAVTDTTATLTITGHSGDWYYKRTVPSGSDTCTEVSGGAVTADLTTLDAGTSHTYKAYSDSNCTPANEIAAESFDTLGLAASAATAAGLKLTLANHTGSWYWKHTAPSVGQCAATAVSGGATASVTGLAAGTSYTFSAYSDAACTTANRLATAAAHATLPPAPGKPTASIPGQASGAVRLGAALGGGAAPVVRWEYAKKAGNGGWDATWTEIAATSKTLDHTITGLAGGTAYQFKVRAVNASGAGAESAASDVVTPRGTALTASAVEADSATLTLSGHTGNWYHKRITPSGDDTCTQVTTPAASLSTLDTGTSYTFKAYSDSTCAAANELASETFLTKPGQVAGVTATAGAASLNVGWTARTDTVTGYRIQWKSGLEDWSATRQTTATTNAAALTGLTDATTYTLRVAATNATGAGAWSADATGTPSASATTLTASAIRATTATLTLVNHTGDWYHKHTVPDGGQCASTAVSSTGTADLTALDAGTNYTWTAYSDVACTPANALASVPFLTRPGQTTGVAAAARNESLAVGWAKVTGAASYTVQWKSAGQQYAAAREATVSGGAATTHAIPALTNGTAYTIRVRAANATGEGAWSADATGTPGAATLTASAVGSTTATLTLAGHDGRWYWKHTVPAGDTSCTGASGATASVADLTAGTRYTFKAYRDAVCATEIAGTPLLTLPGQVTGVAAATRHQSLAASWTAVTGATGYKVQWKSGTQRYQYGGAREATVASGTAYTIPSLTNGTAYDVRVLATNATGAGAWSDDATGTPAGVTLTASAVEASTATLTIANHGGAWYWKYTVPDGGQCTSAGSAATASPAGLDPGTSHTFKAYGDAACTSELTTDATDAELLTKPAQVQGLTLTPGNTTLAVGWTAASGTVTGYRVQWKSGSEEYDARETSTRQTTITGIATTSASITGLTNGTAYSVRVTAYNATGDGPASAQTSATPAAALTASAVEATTATLTIDHGGAWYWKYTVPATPPATCSTEVGAGTKTASPAGLDPGTSYTFKAYADANCTEELTSDATDAELLTKPAQVTGVTVTPGDTTLAVGWTAASGTVTGYKVQWRSGEQSWDAATRQSAVTGGATTAATITGLTNAVTYAVRVMATNATGDGAPSAEANVTPPATAPGQPTGLTVSAEGDAAVTLSWTAGADGGAAVTRWEVSTKAGSGGYGAWTAVPDSGAGTRRHTVTKLANGVVHRFKVRAVNSVGAGPASAESAAATPSVICGRTPAVRDAIVAAVPGKSTCGAVTTADLAGITGNLDLSDSSIDSLRFGDFAGLTGVPELYLDTNDLTTLPPGVFDPMTALTNLNLGSNRISSLPAGVFDRLALTGLNLGNNRLPGLPPGVDRLTTLTYLNLGTNRISSLPAGVFDQLTSLDELYLDTNQLATLPAGVFDSLTVLSDLYTANNPLTCLPHIPASVTGGTRHATKPESSFPACGAGVTVGKSSLSVGAGASKTFTVVLAATPNRFANSGDVIITPASADTTKATVSPATLTFGTGNWSTPQTVTVTGVATGSAAISHGIAGGGYGGVTVGSVAAAVTTVNLAASAVTDTTATLTIAGHSGNWYYKRIAPSGSNACTEVGGGATTAGLTTLDAGTSYTFKAYSDAGCATEIAAESFDTRSLAASAVAATSLTLTLANHPASWYWKHATGTCSGSAVSGPTASVTGLTGGTSYTFSAYSDSNCTTGNRLATAAASATLPPAPGKPTVNVAGQGRGAVRLGAVLGGGAVPIVRWEYTKKAGDGGYDAAWTEIAATSKTLDHRITGLAAGTAYRFKVRAVNATGAGAASAASDAATPRVEALTATAVEAATATLNLAGHDGGAWYWKRITPSGDDTCTAVQSGVTTSSLSSLPTGTSHTYKAYSDSACTAELADVTFLTKPGQVAGVTATAGAASLNVDWTARTGTVTGYKVQWKSGAQVWSTARQTTATTNATVLTGLTDATAYTLRVAAANATGDGAWSAEATGTPSASATTLTASAVQATTATLTIVNHGGGRWYYKHTVPDGGQCASAVIATASLVGLDAGTHYTWKAYSDSNCSAANVLASVPFLTRPGQVTGVTAAARPGSLAVGWTAVTGAAGYTVQWKSAGQQYAAAREATVTGGATTHAIPSLTNGTAYTIRVRADNAGGAGAWSADAAGTPSAVTLTASAVGSTTATLTLAGHDRRWYWKHTVPAGDTSCTGESGVTASLSDLTAGTRYTFKAYGDAVCATELAGAAPFLTAPGQVTGVTAATRRGSLAVGWTAVGSATSYEVQWKSGAQGYESGGARAATVAGGTAYTIPSLTDGAAYTVRVRAINATGPGPWSADAAGTPAVASLTASAVESATATLTIASYGGDWYWKYTVPDGGQCSTAVSGTTAKPAGLAPGTSHTFKAYSDVGCATEVTSDATQAVLLTKPAQVTGLTLTPGAASLAVSWTAVSGTVTGYKVQWRSGAQTFDTTRQKTITGLATTSVITGLTGTAERTVRVMAWNTTGDGPASAEASAAPAATLTASAVEDDTATLTIANHTGGWRTTSTPRRPATRAAPR